MPGAELRFLRNLVLAALIVGAAVLGGTRYVARPWAVRGDSMAPTLRAGDRVVVDLWSLRFRPPRTGEIVLVTSPDGRPLVKRIAGTTLGDPGGPPGRGALRFVLRGDNPEHSEDSRHFGPVPRERIGGRVVWRYWPPSRAGRIR